MCSVHVVPCVRRHVVCVLGNSLAYAMYRGALPSSSTEFGVALEYVCPLIGGRFAWRSEPFGKDVCWIVYSAHWQQLEFSAANIRLEEKICMFASSK